MARILALAAAAAAVHALEPHRTLSTMDLHLVDGSSTGAVCLGELLRLPSVCSATRASCHSAPLPLTVAAALDDPLLADGSHPGFYLRAGASTDNWLIYLQGGGWVYDKPSAVSRSKGNLGSSAHWPKTREGSGMLSADPSSNPDLAHFNVVFFNYCDGFCFSGNNETAMVHNGSKPVFFRGRRIVDRLLDELLQKHGLHQAKTVLLSGSSAGGLAVYMHADHVGSILRAAAPELTDYRAVADAGWFPDLIDVDGTPGLRPVVQWASKLANSSGNEACLVTMRAVHPRTWPSSCFMANELYPFVRTPLFIMEPLYGTHNLFDTIGLECTPAGTTGSKRPVCNASQVSQRTIGHGGRCHYCRCRCYDQWGAIGCQRQVR
jgi:hypothetical protein